MNQDGETDAPDCRAALRAAGFTESEGETYSRVAFVPEIRKIDDEARTVTHLITSDALDRMGDVIDVAGWDFKNFMRSPRVFVDHDYRIEKLIGRATNLTRTGKGIEATTQFTDVGLGAYAFDLVKSEFAGEWSVGFRGNDSHWITDHEGPCETCEAVLRRKKKPRYLGRHFTSQELLEYSLVGIPANPEAVTLAISKGFDPGELYELGILAAPAPETDLRDAFNKLVQAIRSTGAERTAPNEATVEACDEHLYAEILKTAGVVRRVAATIDVVNDAKRLARR